ncbi:MAG: hypothetical protein SPJ98_09960, partial [Sodaliphilus sp.]|nr:hypothetical protein [Sodaliphilus sp.]
MADSLKDKTAKNLFWSAMNNGTMQVLNLLIGIFLGRLLTPGEYGLVGVLTIFTLIAGNLQSIIGGGEAGNVSANIITELDTSIAYVEETFNLEATVLGHEKENLESIKENAPANFRVRDRIITLTDYEDIIRLNFYDFLRLKAVQDSVD